ncbi:DUF2783 domain-containing protein [Trinickia fusca]|uniref:DUF2783 domain-containing protein n=1 Tax=Trinickia fusca TaxID=2419777 RepID=A0A494XKM5_9BURK|nr:DUF2783 domain-containing protein [Trinickia fusca]RKP51267.1 DUF2783 domain-containing protein [Trinickia fusca]
MTAPRTPAHLLTEPRLADPDAFYEALIDMHRDLSAEASELVNAKLILLLANHIGDADVLHEAFALARQDVEPASAPSPQDSPAVENKTHQET